MNNKRENRRGRNVKADQVVKQARKHQKEQTLGPISLQ